MGVSDVYVDEGTKGTDSKAYGGYAIGCNKGEQDH
jgi:hypothetical protein